LARGAPDRITMGAGADDRSRLPSAGEDLAAARREPDTAQTRSAQDRAGPSYSAASR
jgi:hypothetical protein